MTRFEHILREINRRFIWQTLAIYLVFAWVALGVSRAMIEARELPDGFNLLAIILLAIGLPIVLTTAYLQQGIPSLGRSDPTLQIELDLEGSDDDLGVRIPDTGVRSLFTWRNAILGGVAAFTLWALVAVGWLLLAAELVELGRQPNPADPPAREAQ
jgi:hypothetical protein